MADPAGARAGAGAPRARLGFLDACRGVAVLAMLLANFVNVFLRRIPPALAHNQGDRLRLFDFPAPTFQFLIGVSLALFLEKRGSASTPRAAKLDAFRRFVLLILLGTLLDSVGTLHLALRWGVLQTLGLGGLAATLLADAPFETVGAVAIALLGAFSGALNGEVHGSPLAALAFAPLTLAGLMVGRVLVESPPRGPVSRRFIGRTTAVALVAAALAALLYGVGIPFNKVLGTSSFVALAGAVAALALIATALLERAGAVFPRWLLAVGSNALTAWVLQYMLVFYPAWIAFPSWRRLAFLPGMAVIFGTMVAISRLTIALGRRGIRYPI